MSEGPKWTAEQRLAIETRGTNLLVSASAGTGKTAVLVERVIGLVTGDPPVDIERFLVVTFTEKAAQEMKARVRAALEKKIAESSEDTPLRRQLDLLEKAQISTIHAFCLRMLRRFFHQVDLDPSFRVLDTGEADLLKQDAIDEVFEDMYQASDVFHDLVDMYGGRGVDEGLKATVARLYDFASTQPSMDGWLEEARTKVHSAACVSSESGNGSADVGPDPRGSVWRLPWTRSLLKSAVRDLDRALQLAQEAREICLEPDGPSAYLGVVEEEVAVYSKAKELAERLLASGDEGNAGDGSGVGCSPEGDSAEDDVGPDGVDSLQNGTPEQVGEVLRQLLNHEFARMPSIRKPENPVLKEEAQDRRNAAKEQFRKIGDYAFMRPAEQLIQELTALSPYLDCLIAVVKQLDVRYTAKKLDRGGLDFSDLERYCLLALSKDDGAVASQVRSEFDYVLVDEYQDTNPVQEALLALVTRDGDQANLFTVGDIKQSIYRFRLAEPRIFLERHKRYAVAGGHGGAESGGLRVDLSTNFRSRSEVLDAANWVFERIMRADLADIDYDEGHRLRLGAGYPACEDDTFVAELHLLEREVPDRAASSKGGEQASVGPGGTEQGGTEQSRPEQSEDSAQETDTSFSDSSSALEDYEAVEKEAFVVASRIAEMVNPGNPLMLWDAGKKALRPCSYKDIAILMRSTKERANAVLEALGRAGIPAYADTATGYFQAREVEIALSLLSIIDNPRQDIPLAAVLRSPIVGLSAEDLATVRIHDREGDFYDAVVAASRADSTQASPDCGLSAVGDSRLSVQLRQFLSDLDRWRTMARRKPLAEVLWTILRETGYEDYVGGLPGGAQRQANLRVLCDRARQFDSFGHHGLFRFLRFIERLQESDGDLGAARALGEQEDVVRVLSIHKAKGLEFPVVFVMDLGKRFNTEDLRQDILFHRELGIGAQYCDLVNRVKYPSLAHQSIALKLKEENLAEEMRVLYVALTRAKEKLCLVGSARDLERMRKRWQRLDIASAGTYLDWLCPVILTGEASSGQRDNCEAGAVVVANSDTARSAPSGVPPFCVRFWGTEDGLQIPLPQETRLQSDYSTGDRAAEASPLKKIMETLAVDSDEAVYSEVKRRLEWTYPLIDLTTTPARMSVGELKRRLDTEEEDSWRFIPRPNRRLAFDDGKAQSEGIRRGIATHTVLARMNLLASGSPEEVRAEAVRLADLGFLQPSEVDDVDVSSVAAFFATPAGQMITANPDKVRRELPFTLSVPAAVAAGQTSTPRESTDAGDEVLLQGVIDVLVEDQDGLTILDYKTDALSSGQIGDAVARYSPQVALYALAAETILGKPVRKAIIAFLTAGEVHEVDWRGYLASRGLQLPQPMG